MGSVRSSPWATEYNVELGLVLEGCSLRWPAGVSSNLDYSTSLKPGLFPFWLQICCISALSTPGAAKRPMQCSEEFKELLAQPTFGARNLSKHWTKAGIVLPEGKPTPDNTQAPSEQTLVAFYFGLVCFLPRCWKEARGKFPVCLCFSTAQATETEIAGGQKKAIWRDSEAVMHTDFHRKGSVTVTLSITMEVFCSFNKNFIETEILQ